MLLHVRLARGDAAQRHGLWSRQNEPCWHGNSWNCLPPFTICLFNCSNTRLVNAVRTGFSHLGSLVVWYTNTSKRRTWRMFCFSPFSFRNADSWKWVSWPKCWASWSCASSRKRWAGGSSTTITRLRCRSSRRSTPRSCHRRNAMDRRRSNVAMLRFPVSVLFRRLL